MPINWAIVNYVRHTSMSQLKENFYVLIDKYKTKEEKIMVRCMVREFKRFKNRIGG